MTISTSSRLLVAGTVLLATSTHVEGIDHFKSVPRVETKGISTKDDEDVEAFASGVLRKKRSNVEMAESGASPNKDDHKNSFPTDPKTPMDNSSKANSPTKPKPHPVRPDSGALKMVRDVGSFQDETNAPLRQEFAPYLLSNKHSKNKALSFHLRCVQVSGSCNETSACAGSDPICAKDGSCNFDNACRNSSNLQVESGACNSYFACSYSPEMVVGMESCLGGVDAFDVYSGTFVSCFRSPGSCVGLRSCQSNSSSYGACSFSAGIHVSDDSCLGPIPCIAAPGATIEHESCHKMLACAGSGYIIVDQFSCRSDSACSLSPNTTIGKYSCNCPYCCRYLEPGCMIPDFSCNDGRDSCSFESGSLGCPNFTLN